EHVFQDQRLGLGLLRAHASQVVERRPGQGRENVVVIAEVLIGGPAIVAVPAGLTGSATRAMRAQRREASRWTSRSVSRSRKVGSACFRYLVGGRLEFQAQA